MRALFDSSIYHNYNALCRTLKQAKRGALSTPGGSRGMPRRGIADRRATRKKKRPGSILRVDDAGAALLRALDEDRRRVFKVADEPGQEFRGSRAVIHAVIEGKRQGKDLPDHDLSSLDPRLVGYLPGAQDRDVGIVDDRRGKGGAVGPVIGDRKGAPLEVFKLDCPFSCLFAQVLQFHCKLADGLLVDVPDDRDDEPFVGIDCNADIEVLLDDYFESFFVHGGIEGAELHERVLEGLHEERHEGKVDAFVLKRLFFPRPEVPQVGDVRLVRFRHEGRGMLGEHQILCDRFLEPSHLHPLDRSVLVAGLWRQRYRIQNILPRNAPGGTGAFDFVEAYALLLGERPDSGCGKYRRLCGHGG